MKWYISTYNGILDDLQNKVQSNLTTPRDADVWVIWQDCAGSYKNLLEACEQVDYHKPTYCVQHGRAATGDYDAPNNWKLKADRFLCWGKNDYDRLVKLGYGDKVHIVGCPLNKYILPKIQHREKIVLFIPVNTGKEEPENIATYYELLKIRYNKAQIKMLDNRSSLKDRWGFNGKLNVSFNEIATDFDVAAKLLPWHDKNLYHGNSVVGYQASRMNNELLFSLLRNVDLVVGLDEGTSEVFAFAHDVPVIVVDGFKYRQHESNGKDFKTQDIYRTKAAQHCELKDLSYWIDYCLDNPQYLKKERKEVAEQELGISYRDATENIYNFIRKDIKIKYQVGYGIPA